jgi:peptidoglycan/LPS O-acetylase OafA/YrhL
MPPNTSILSQADTVESPQGSSRRVVLDGLRFLTAGLIVLFHYQSEGPRSLTGFSPLFQRGYLATDFFLILSAYVLGRAYGRKVLSGAVSDERFLAKRLLRVWPAHIIVLAAFAAVVGLSATIGLTTHDPAQLQWSNLPAQALLIHAWGLDLGAGWNLPTWSLSALVVCYAAFPSLWRKLSRVSGALLLFGGGVAVIWAANGLSQSLYGRVLYDLPFNLGVLRALPLFAFGACIARASELNWPSERLAPVMAVVAGVMVIGLQFVGRFDLLSMILLGVLIAAGGVIRAPRGASFAALAGRISFALYITHILVAMVWFRLTHIVIEGLHLSEPVQWALWAMAFPLAVATALAFERWIDSPVQAVVNRWADRLTFRRSATVASEAAPR